MATKNKPKPGPIVDPIEEPIEEPIEDPVEDGSCCFGCACLCSGPGEIPINNYHDADQEEPVLPYKIGERPCDDACHG